MKTDWLFLLPAAFYIVDMMPFYLSGSEHKVAVMRLNIGNQARMFSVAEGWIKIRGFHLMFRYIWGFFMMSLLISLIFKNRNFFREKENFHNRKLYLFIVSLTALYMPLLFPGIIGAVFHMRWFSLDFITANLAIVLAVSSIYYLLSPSILYGFLPKPAAEMYPILNGEKRSVAKPFTSAEPVMESAAELFLKQSETEQILKKIEWLMKEKSPFLNKEYTIHDLSTDTGVPVYQLSPIINQHYKCTFNSWLNKYRIDYFIALCARPENRGLTIEALSKDAGFSNRTTFSTAFKKEKNQTPGFYLKQLYTNIPLNHMTS
jgi:AraC-like DNA-binding protein